MTHYDRRLIGGGESAEVWAIGDDRVLKLFRANVNMVPVELELAASRRAHALGLPVARPIDLLQQTDRTGILFDRIEGPTLLSAIRRRPFSMWPGIAALAQVHANVHGHAIAPPHPPVPRLVDVLRHRIERSAADPVLRAAALARLEALPAMDRLCHGDLHPANVIQSPTGPVVIDWSKAAVGNPAADVARTDMLIRFGPRGRGVSPLAARVTAAWYRRCYMRHGAVSGREIDAWRLPVAVAWYRGQPELAASGLTKWLCRQLDR